MAEYKEVRSAELYKRLSEALGISRDAVKDLQRGYKQVYLECINNGETFTLPGIGIIKMLPYEDEMIYKVKEKIIAPRVNKYRIKYCESETAKRARKSAE